MLLIERGDVYWNVRRKVYSIRSEGRVRWHTTNVLVANAQFKVSVKGQARVIVEGVKNVHAYIRGEIHRPPEWFRMEHGTLLTYRPYEIDDGGFVPVFHPFPESYPIIFASTVWLTVENGRPRILARGTQAMKSWHHEVRCVELRGQVRKLALREQVRGLAGGEER